ncbi:MAG: hypothetical protein EP332_14220 [Bacteroidetes bacterium]|nr:MAG: hypothetical protein EP332_14220 [Bacteroidota bacterium]
MNFQFPSDFLDYYLHSAGSSSDEEFEKQSLWDLQKMAQENVASDSKIIFSDFMLRCPWIAFDRSTKHIIKGYGYPEEEHGIEVIAPSFTEFLALRQKDAELLY